MSQHKTELNLKALYTGSTNNVFKSVTMGKVPAGVTLDSDLEREPTEIKNQLKIIMLTPKMAPHPVSVHPRVPKALQEKMTDAFLKLSKDPQGLDLLKNARIGETTRSVYGRDYKELESVNYDLLTKGK